MWRGSPSWTWAQVDGAAGSQIVAPARSDLFADEGEFVERLRRATDVLVVESTNVGQGNRRGRARVARRRAVSANPSRARGACAKRGNSGGSCADDVEGVSFRTIT
jgi:hypothetical protein